jgi:DNA repair photolyase
MKPIYEPRGAAKEYGDLALNIYTGCPHRCYYCFAPGVLRRDREKFHSDVRPRENIIEETRRQLEREGITGKLNHLCFTCDPYPTGYDTTPTREIIKLLKEYGNHVQILTKGDGSRDLDLLDENDWYGITIDGGKAPAQMHHDKMTGLELAHNKGIKTWISFEPVLDADNVLWVIQTIAPVVADKVKIGKLNYHQSDIDWKRFGRDAEALCQMLGLDYYIKDSLRAEMEK